MKGIINNGYIEVKKYPEPEIKYNDDNYEIISFGDERIILPIKEPAGDYILYNALTSANIASPEEDVWRIEPDDLRIVKNEAVWYPVVCLKCGWIGSSEFAGGGGQIADTGDYSDPCCPKCWSNVDEADNEYPNGTEVEFNLVNNKGVIV